MRRWRSNHAMSLITSQLEMVLLLFLALLFSDARAQRTFFPAAVPLAVRSPYLSSWDHTTNGTVFGSLWPATDNFQILGWAVFVRVDGVTYSVMGQPRASVINGTANLTDIVITPTQTVVTSQVGPMQVNLTFLNPIEPGDWVKQSVPFSYISLTATSLDGAPHSVQLYTDVSGEWNSGDRNQEIVWSLTSNTDAIYHNVRLPKPAVFNEISNQAEWGNLYYAIKPGNGVTYKIAADDTSRGMFLLSGALDNQIDTNFRAISSTFPVFALSSDFGNISTVQPVVWAVGYTTDPAISYADLSGGPPTQRNLYYKSQYSSGDGPLIVDFLNNFTDASSRAQALDKKILQDAASVSGPLGDLVSLAIAQVYGSTQLTIGTDSLGSFNASDVMMFMKNIGGLVPNRANAVETLYSAFPAFMYLDPSLGGPLLEPLLRLQASSNYSIQYAAADLGSTYPNVTSTNSTHNQGVEQSGNMLIMTYAHARATGDGSLISRYYPLLTSWADYLTNSTLFIHDQSSADGLTVSNQTNLAIKGIIAIEAMSKMSTAAGQTADANKFSSAAARLYDQWKALALSSDQHVLAVYGQSSSWTLCYNLFADVWLGTNLVDSSIFNAHSSFIDNITKTSTFSNFGMPIDNLLSDTTSTTSSWNLFVAGMTQNGALSSDLISRVHNRASFNISAGVFPLNYDSSQGSTIEGAASPAQGAMFAPLALKAPVLTIKVNGTIGTKQQPAASSHTGAIAGAIAGGAAIAILVIGATVFVWRRRRLSRRDSTGSKFTDSSVEGGPSITVTPFNPSPLDTTPQVPDSWMEQQQLLPGSPEGMASDPRSLTSTPAPALLRLRPVVPAPPGLSSKELARLRAESSQTHTQHSADTAVTTQSLSTPTESTAQSGVTSSTDTRRLQSEVESLRREMQQLRVERFEPPPSYTSGDV